MPKYVPSYWKWRWYGFDICDIHGTTRVKLTHWHAMKYTRYDHLDWFKLWLSRIGSSM